MNRSIIIAIGIVLLFPVYSFAISIIPGEYGWGMSADFGRGNHSVRYVTNTNSSGAGSFSQAINDHNNGSTPSVIVFETSGSITPSSSIRISRDKLIIAGQTAPSPGIELRTTMTIRASEVLIQHIRLRPANGGDGLVIRDELGGGIKNIVIDHCSFSWATDENVSIWEVDGVNNVTVQHCLIAEALWGHYGFLAGSDANHFPFNILLHANLFGMNYDRNPLMKARSALILNNVSYAWGNRALHFASHANYTGIIEASAVGNFFLKDDATELYSKKPIWTYGIGTSAGQLNSGSEIFLKNNDCNSDFNPCYEYSGGSNPYDLGNSDPITWPSGLKDKIGDSGWTHSQLKTWVIDNAGARPKDRDTVDNDIIAKIKNGTGTKIYCVEYNGGDSNCNEAGEYAYINRPTIPVKKRTLTVPANPNRDDDNDGYTNLEEWLHSYSANLENTSKGDETSAPQPPTNLRVINN